MTIKHPFVAAKPFLHCQTWSSPQYFLLLPPVIETLQIYRCNYTIFKSKRKADIFKFFENAGFLDLYLCACTVTLKNLYKFPIIAIF